MDEGTPYISSIPTNAREEDITGKPGSVRGKAVKNYYLGRSYVGKRVYHKNGQIEHECSYKNGKRHGWEYLWYEDGSLKVAIPHCDGREDVKICVWGRSGALLGSYAMIYGTGIDFWWIEIEGKAHLTEARVVVDNKMDGYEYWFAWYSPGELRKEKWWSRGCLHGIEREWNEQGNLRRGFPKYWIYDQQADKRAYDRATRTDTTLKPFRIEDNLPYRTFPPEVALYLPTPSDVQQGEIQ